MDKAGSHPITLPARPEPSSARPFAKTLLHLLHPGADRVGALRSVAGFVLRKLCVEMVGASLIAVSPHEGQLPWKAAWTHSRICMSKNMNLCCVNYLDLRVVGYSMTYPNQFIFVLFGLYNLGCPLWAAGPAVKALL